ncbi:MAG: hypothetical protein ABIQ93_16775 [Saprospiraceae bacterium]
MDKTQNRIYVNVPDAGKIQVADLSTRRVIANWKNTAAANFPMAINENDHHLFIGCRRPATLRVIDTQTGKGIANLPCSGDADEVFIDPSANLLPAITINRFLPGPRQST